VTGSTISQSFVSSQKIPHQKLPNTITVTNANGTHNAYGQITHSTVVLLQIGEHVEHKSFIIATLQHHDFYLGYDWLQQHNPSIDWTNFRIKFNRCPSECGSHSLQEEVIYKSLRAPKNLVSLRSFVPPRINVSTELAIQQEKQKEKKSWRQIVPKEYHEFKDILTKKEFDQLPPNHPWDHAIELWPDVIASVKGKVYPMDSKCEEELQKFLNENLSTHQIHPSNSPIASSFFFIKKKDGALHPVQDYHQLNEKTVRDQYPIPLISNIINSLQQSEWFTKLNICWGYNNIQIKAGDE
jgi:Retroviral aspartyl protease